MRVIRGAPFSHHGFRFSRPAFFGGEWLVRGAVALAVRLRMSSLAIGLTVVAFGTSAPELVVSLQAVLSGANDISLGNVVGSNIANIALILGLAAIIQPLTPEAKMIRVDLPLLVLASLGLVAILWDGRIARAEGGVLVASLAAYTFFTLRAANHASESLTEDLSAVVPEGEMTQVKAWTQVAAGLAGLVLGGYLLVDSSVTLARLAGLSEAVIGLTIVAVGTSLPEMATTLVAARRGQGDIAIGSVAGSNLFNILCILGVTAFVAPLVRGAIGWGDLAVMVLLAVALLAVLAVRRRLSRIEGIVLLIAYAGYITWKLALGP